jgi:hypothetical protein
MADLPPKPVPAARVPAAGPLTSSATSAEPDVPKPGRLKIRSRLWAAYLGNEVFHWLVWAVPVIFLGFALIWVLITGLLENEHWRTGFNIFLGAVPPTVSKEHYLGAALLAVMGYFFVPAFIGAVVSAIVAVVAVRRMSPSKRDKIWEVHAPDISRLPPRVPADENPIDPTSLEALTREPE